MNLTRTGTYFLLSLMIVIELTSGLVFAENFKKKHPRRAQVNAREKKQQNRIANGIKSGKINAQQAQHLEGQEAALKQQERSDVKANGGSLTNGQQKQLNQEENQLSKEIYKDKHQ